MIYTLQVNYNETENISYQVNTDIFNVTYSDMINEINGTAETNHLNIGTINGTIVLTDFWRQLRRIPLDDIQSIQFLDLNGDEIYTFTQPIVNIIYNINLNTIGDMIIFDFSKE